MRLTGLVAPHNDERHGNTKHEMGRQIGDKPTRRRNTRMNNERNKHGTTRSRGRKHRGQPEHVTDDGHAGHVGKGIDTQAWYRHKKHM